ncbi:MAG TPA: hypothetical protein VF169_20910 [Albitalea sp.]|uniref:hypothetical protein n=1 Tax=Piscinibacter sp. TaxID=1903157 RepID=UPI002ED2B73F
MNALRFAQVSVITLIAATALVACQRRDETATGTAGTSSSTTSGTTSSSGTSTPSTDASTPPSAAASAASR